MSIIRASLKRRGARAPSLGGWVERTAEFQTISEHLSDFFGGDLAF